MCRALIVSRSGYYEWCLRKLSEHALEDERMLVETKRVHRESRGTYGSPRVHAQLRIDGFSVSEYKVAKLMNRAGLAGKVRRRFKKTTDSNHALPIAPNILEREFDAQTVDSAWCADITYVHTNSGWVYLAAILDLGTRLIVGWSMADHMRTELIEGAFLNALSWRNPAKEIVHHSDRGSQYASKDYRDLLSRHDFVCSMSRAGNCWDNAAMESFFGTLKQELIHGEKWAGLQDVKSATHEYIEVFYNRRRLHSSLGFRTPASVDDELNAAGPKKL